MMNKNDQKHILQWNWPEVFSTMMAAVAPWLHVKSEEAPDRTVGLYSLVTAMV